MKSDALAHLDEYRPFVTPDGTIKVPSTVRYRLKKACLTSAEPCFDPNTIVNVLSEDVSKTLTTEHKQLMPLEYNIAVYFCHWFNTLILSLGSIIMEVS